ncbi:MAG TPA: EamA family transporter [Rhodopila sp.]|nr:EamA family transporter [Rhodopila sp.]
MPILPGFYLALVLYGTATVVWIYVLSRVPLIEAYPWIAGATVTVPLIGWWCYGEQVTPSFWLGMAMIVAGLLLTQLGTLRQWHAVAAGIERNHSTGPARSPTDGHGVSLHALIV